MIRQKSFVSQRPTVYLVPTPIGNLTELTSRALDILNQVDLVAAEDTRNTRKLLTHYGIHKSLLACHEHNQKVAIPQVLEAIESGKSIAVVSDAGYPLVSDPGQHLVETLIQKEIPVVSISGPNAALDALVASGLPCYHYMFYGFLDNKHNKRVQELETLKAFPYTILFYEAPHRIQTTLTDMLTVLGDRKMVLARELTKVHEEYLRGTISEILDVCEELKGEMVIVMDGYQEEDSFDLDKAVDRVIDLSQTMKLKEACKQVAKETGASKNVLYQEALKRK